MTRYCENCGCDVQEGVQVFPGPLRKECAECGSTGPFMAENPHYDPGTDEHRAGRPSPPIAATRCGYTTAAGIRCRRDEGHAGAHDTLYIFDALPERPEPMDDPLPEDLERVLRDPEFVTDQDYALHFWLADYVRRHPDETITSRAYLGLWALYERTLRDADA